jgi:D-amino peptidase
MKAYLSADIEGVTGIAHWDEATAGQPGYDRFCTRFQEEVSAVCKGAMRGGADQIIVQDAHDSARNLDHEALPEAVALSRGWSEHPKAMIQDLDESFQALLMVGWHSGPGTGATPLAHSMHTGLQTIDLCGHLGTEFLLHAWLASEIGVPTVFLSGDAALCAEARAQCRGIRCVETHLGKGGSILAPHPKEVRRRMEEQAAEALQTVGQASLIELPKTFDLNIRYTKDAAAYKASFFPGAKRVAPHELSFRAESMSEIFRALLFLL